MGRPITVPVGGLATAAVNKASLTQKAAISGTNYLVLNGAAGAFTANSVCASQTPGGAGALVINGTLASSVPSGTAVAYLPQASRIYITSNADESGKTFVVVGRRSGPGGGPFAVTETITGPSTSTASSINQYDQIISITASAGTSGAITVGHYNTATLDVARQVLFTSAGNDAGTIATIVGTDVNGAAITDLVTLTASTATSALDFKTIASISTNAAIASTIQVGTNTVSHSQFVRFDDYAANAQVAIQCTVSGTANYTLQVSMDDPNIIGGPITPYNMTWVDHTDTAVVNATATKTSNFGVAPVFARVQLNSGTGTVTSTFRQAYLG